MRNVTILVHPWTVEAHSACPPYIYNPARVTHDCWGRIAENHQACCQKKRAFGYTKMHRVYKNRSRNMEQHGFIESVNGRWL